IKTDHCISDAPLVVFIRTWKVDYEDILIYSAPNYVPSNISNTLLYITENEYQETSNLSAIEILVGDATGCGGTRPCYTDNIYRLTFSADPCEWVETEVPICGSGGFVVRANVTPTEGVPPTLVGTPKAVYCPGDDALTFE